MKNPSPLEILGGPVGSGTLFGCLVSILLWLILLAACSVALVWAWRFIVRG